MLLRLIATSTVCENHNITKMSTLTSSILNEWEDINKYSLINLFADDNDTAWCEGVKGNGIGEYVIMRFGDRDIERIRVKNGFTKNSTTYYDNNRVKELTIYIHNNRMEPDYENTHFQVSLSDDTLDFQDIVIPEKYRKGINIIKLQIDSIYNSKKSDNTCISKLELWHNNSKYSIAENALIDLSTNYYLKSINLESKFYNAFDQTCDIVKLFVKITDNIKYTENVLLSIDRRYFYINDFNYTEYGIKAKHTKLGYKYRYRYKFENDRLYILRNDKWILMKFIIHYYYNNSYDAGTPVIDFDYDFIKGTYITESCGPECVDEKCMKEKIGTLYDQLIPL